MSIKILSLVLLCIQTTPSRTISRTNNSNKSMIILMTDMILIIYMHFTTNKYIVTDSRMTIYVKNSQEKYQ